MTEVRGPVDSRSRSGHNLSPQSLVGLTTSSLLTPGPLSSAASAHAQDRLKSCATAVTVAASLTNIQ